MKRAVVLAGLLFLAGCSAEDHIKNIIRDQQFASYRTELDQLEKKYLQKKITYAEYLESKRQVEEGYQKTIDQRRELIQNSKTGLPDRETVP